MLVLQELIASLPEKEKRLLGHGLLIGRAISEYRESFGRGDFVIRQIMGIQEQTGSIAVTDHMKVGQTIQFQVRDADTATEDLDALLSNQSQKPPANAGLLFSCNGRGTRMFDRSGHDIAIARTHMPSTPVAGFFATGELGPVGGKNFIHGHTASFALLRARKEPA